MNVSVVAVEEYQRVGLLLAKMVIVSPIEVSSCCWKEDIFISPFAAVDSAMGVAVAKSPDELTEADAMAFMCQGAYVSPAASVGIYPLQWSC